MVLAPNVLQDLPLGVVRERALRADEYTGQTS